MYRPQNLRDHREFSFRRHLWHRRYFLVTRPSGTLLAVPDRGRLQRVMDKLRLCMGPVKSQAQYIVLFFQMCRSAVKLLNFRVLPGNRGLPRGSRPGFPQGYVRTIEVQRRPSSASLVSVWLDWKRLLLTATSSTKMLSTLRARIG